jgi:translocation and assembly module TamB
MVEGTQGTLSGPLHIAHLTFENAALHADIQGLQFDWSPHLLGQRRVAVNYLRLGNLHLTLKDKEEVKEEEPLTLPQSLVLPVGVEVHEVSIERLTITKGGTDHPLSGLNVRLNSDAAHHVLVLSAARTPIGAVRGEVQLGAARPFPLQGTLDLSQTETSTPYQLKTLLSGDLNRVGITATAEAQGARAQVNTLVTPFDPVPFAQLEVQANALNPAQLKPDAPTADIALSLKAHTETEGKVTGKMEIINTLPGNWDQKRLPLKGVFTQFSGKANQWQFTEVRLDLAQAGQFSGQGGIEQGKAQLALATDNLNLQGLQASLQPTKLAGEIRLNTQGEAQRVAVDLRQDKYRIELSAEHAADKLTLHSASVHAGPGSLALAGGLDLSKERSFTAKGKLERFDPAALGDYPPATINCEFSAEGQLAPEAHGKLQFSIDESTFNRQPLSGRGQLEVDAKRRIEADVNLALADNQLKANGDFGAPDGRLRWRIDAPRLERIGPAFGGVLHVSGTLQGSYEKPALDFTLDAARLRLPGDYAIARMDGEGKLHRPPDGVLEVAFNLVGLRAQEPLLDSARLKLAGTLSRHALNLNMRGPKLDLGTEFAGGWHKESGWSGVIRRFQNEGIYKITLLSPAELTLSPDRVRLAKAAFALADGTFTIAQLEKEGARLTTRGELRGLALAKLLQWAPRPPPLETTLALGGEWSLSASDRVNGHFVLQRERGDVELPASEKIALGLDRLHFDTRIENNQARLDLEVAGSRLGRLSLYGSTGLSRINGNWGLAGHAPLAVRAEANVGSLSWLGLLGGGDMETDGRLTMRLNGAGTVANPQLQGYLRGDDLGVKLFEQGVALKDGTLEVDFSNDSVLLKRLVFHGGEGEIKISGTATLENKAPVVGLEFNLTKLQALALPDRQLVASGAGRISLQDQQLRLEGKIKADRALIEPPDLQSPTLSQDVVVVGTNETTEEKRAPAAAQLDLTFDLGNEFYVKAKGLDAKLVGLLTVRSGNQGYGSIRVARGSYSAYGQNLTIQQGIINFNGPMDNPGLNILAVRKNPAIEAGTADESQVEAGVKITGTALAPQVILVSTPEVPDGEKLAWLVLGHGLSGTSQSEFDLLGTAANALLARGESVTLQARIAQALGLSEFGLEGGGQLQSTVVVLGKKISSRTYLTFEQGLRGVSRSVAKLRYELNPRWSVQAATGTENAVDLFYTIRFD